MTNVHITIETDSPQTPSTQGSIPATGSMRPAESIQVTDGGIAPVITGMSPVDSLITSTSQPTGSESGAVNAGPPPQWLYNAIEEAMKEGALSSSPDLISDPLLAEASSLINDGGIAPQNGHK